jgi:hypothetical protein
MNDEYVTPDEIENGGQRKTIIIAVVALVLICCICAVVAGVWFGGDWIMDRF